MNTQPEMEQAPAAPKKTLAVKIFGVGGAGIKVMETVVARALPGVELTPVDMDADALARSSAHEKILLETRLLRGLGSGGDSERARALAEENLPRLKSACDGADVVFIVTGLGGGAGSGIAPVLARAAREAGALTLAFAALPFQCEGNRRQFQAQHGLQELKAAADGVICLPNQQVLKLIDENSSLVETFAATNELLAEGVRGIWRLLAHKGLIEIHFADLCALLRDRHGESFFATAEAAGSNRSREVLEKLFAHPMLDGGKMLAEAGAVLVSLTGGTDLSMAEVNRVMENLNGKCAGAQIIMGAAVDGSFSERLSVTIVATRRAENDDAAETAHEAGGAAGALHEHLLDQKSGPRPGSRFLPPPPALPPETMEQLATGRGRGSRSRRPSSKMRQQQLPLEIISKGRFDKSEPTIHKGEDLDIPTYIRRGVALN